MVNTNDAWIWIYFVRGLPGTGKSTLARQLHDGFPEGTAYVRCADDYFYLYDPGSPTKGKWLDTLDVEFDEEHSVYNYNPKLVGQAHAWCQEEFVRLIKKEFTRAIILPNTFACRWEIQVYLKIAEELGFRNRIRPVFIDLFDQHVASLELAHTNTHDVPVEAIMQMKERWEHDLSKGDPRPPWERSEAGPRWGFTSRFKGDSNEC